MCPCDRERAHDLVKGCALHELLGTTHRAAHGLALGVHSIAPREFLQPQRGTEGREEKDAVVLGPRHHDVVTSQVSALCTAVHGGEHDTVRHDHEGGGHGFAVALARRRDTGLRVAHEFLKTIELTPESHQIDVTLLAHTAGGKPPAGVGVGEFLITIRELVTHGFHRVLIVVGVQLASQLLTRTWDHAERAGDTCIEARGRTTTPGDAPQEGLLDVMVLRPLAELSHAVHVDGNGVENILKTAHESSLKNARGR